MKFVPKGYLPLTAAVDQLAEARRAAGQTNDERKNVARAELRAELHSGSISTLVVSPNSGKTFEIRAHHWASEKALTSLEQGECLLTEGLVNPPLDLLYPKERVMIFVSLHDFQRLVNNQEVKQEAVPPHDSLPPPKPLSEAAARKKFHEWRESCGDNIPSEKDDIDHMKQYGVSRDRVRKLRQRPGVKRRPTGKRRQP